MTDFVLVHGAFRGGWSWRFVRERLEAAGHRVWTPSLTGMGDRAHLVAAEGPVLRLATWVEDVAAVVRSNDLRDVVLAGHSLGGFVADAATAAIHDRLAAVVLFDAPVGRDGERAVDLNPPGVPTPRAEDLDLSLALPARPVGADEGFEPELAAWVNDRLGPTPLGPSFDPIELDAAARAVPRSYVFFSDTPETFPCWSTRRRLEAEGTAFTVIDGPHDAPLVRPAEVAAFLRGRPEAAQ